MKTHRRGAEDAEMELNKLTEQIIGAAIEVHKALGPGLLESAYEECLAHEMRLRGAGDAGSGAVGDGLTVRPGVGPESRKGAVGQVGGKRLFSAKFDCFRT